MAIKKAPDNSILSVRKAAEILGICPATLKNWIKLGKISADKRGASYVLDKSEVNICLKRLESSDSLRKRRNKSLSDSNFIPKSYIDSSSPNYKTIIEIVHSAGDCEASTEDILMFYASALLSAWGISKVSIKKLTKNHNLSGRLINDTVFSYSLVPVTQEDTLGMLYLSLRSLREKKATGSYYTPFFAADKLCETVLPADDSYEDKTICDPACGTGNFLIRLPDSFKPENIYGIDIDSIAITIARINLAIRYHLDDAGEIAKLFKNIICADFLNLQPGRSFDITIGNPPWGVSFTPEESLALKKTFRSAAGVGRPESFSLFTEKAMSVSDTVAFLLPETILESGTHTRIRELIMENGTVKSLIYLGDIFDKVQCPCIILEAASSYSISSVNVSFYKRSKKTLNLQRSFSAGRKRLTALSFQLIADDLQHSIIQKMEACKHFTLKGNAEFALGIVSGSNTSLIHSEKAPGLEPIVKGTDIEKFRLKEPSSFVSFSEDEFQQVAPEKYYRNKDKLFYRFIAPEPIIAHDSNGYLSLNSANIIVPRKEGYSSFYIMAVLNSSCISYYYRHTCRNMKVLRNKLEQLPIPLCSAETTEKISALAESVSMGIAEADALDREISALFGLTEEEIRAISQDC